MGENKYNNNGSVTKVDEQVEDRLSSLPDDVLVHDILSRLNIDVAAATSVLSCRWRDLWKGVTRFEFSRIVLDSEKCKKISSFIFDIIRQLNSPKLSVFHVDVQSRCLSYEPKAVEPWLNELRCREVEHIVIKGKQRSITIFYAPASLFRAKSLVSLELSCFIVLSESATTIQLPKLKNLYLNGVFYFPSWFGTIFSSCPLLETFHVSDNHLSDKLSPDLRIVAPNLKSFEFHTFATLNPTAKIFVIDAPRLTNFRISDYVLSYHFSQEPTHSIHASLKYDEVKRRRMEIAVEEYLHQMFKFFRYLSSVNNLMLCIEQVNPIDIHTHLDHPVVNSHQPLPIFCNLASLTLRWDGCSLDGWKTSLLLLHCFPSLTDLNLFVVECSVSLNYWVPPELVPECLAYKLKTVEIAITAAANSIDVELVLLAYILSNATVLEKLFVSVEFETTSATTKTQLQDACNKFCNSLFNLPRRSSICEIEFKNSYLTASSTDYNV